MTTQEDLDNLVRLLNNYPKSKTYGEVYSVERTSGVFNLRRTNTNRTPGERFNLGTQVVLTGRTKSELYGKMDAFRQGFIAALVLVNDKYMTPKNNESNA